MDLKKQLAQSLPPLVIGAPVSGGFLFIDIGFELVNP
jgi:hypothetical protein